MSRRSCGLEASEARTAPSGRITPWRNVARRISSRIRLSTARRRYTRNALACVDLNDVRCVNVRCSVSCTRSLVSTAPRARRGRRPRAQCRSHDLYRSNSTSTAGWLPRRARSSRCRSDVESRESDPTGLPHRAQAPALWSRADCSRAARWPHASMSAVSGGAHLSAGAICCSAPNLPAASGRPRRPERRCGRRAAAHLNLETLEDAKRNTRDPKNSAGRRSTASAPSVRRARR